MTQRVVNYKYGTGNPVLPDGSVDVRDGIDNLQSFDVFMNADEDTYNQRDGDIVKTRAGAVRDIGVQRIGDFTTGCTVTQRNQGVLYETDGTVYVWLGALPKVVPPASSPATTGGISQSGWLDIGDASAFVRILSLLSEPDGSSLIGFEQYGAGSVPRAAQDKMRERRTFMDFGAVGTMSTDDTVEIQNALNTNKPVRAVAERGYIVYDTLTAKAENMINGEGFQSAVFFDNFPATKDGLVLSPIADGIAKEYSGFSNVYMYQNLGGRHAVVVDLEAANKRLARFVCEKSYFLSNGVGHYAFYVSNSTNAADKFFLAYFENNVFNGGLGLDGVGDSINITGNTFTGVNESLLFKQTTEFSPDTTAPSSLLVFERNNCSANKGIYIMEARAPKIINNNLECGAGPGAGAEQALVNIKGITQRIVGAEITGNAILHAPNCPNGVYLGNTDGALVENNIFGMAATGSGIVISADSKNAKIGSNTFIPTGTGREVTDLGVGTKGVLKYPSLLNGWSAVSGREPPKFFKGLDGWVKVTGVIGSGLLSANVELFVLPVGFRPVSRCLFSTFVYTTGDTFGTAVLRADPDGTVRLAYVSTGAVTVAEMGISAITFVAPDVP